MLVFTLFAGTSVYAQKLENGIYKGGAYGYGSNKYVRVSVSVSGREIEDISVSVNDTGPDEDYNRWMNELINGDGSYYFDSSLYFARDETELKEILLKQQEYKENFALLKKEGPRYTSVQDFADAIVKNQSTVIDVMSGATQTCEAVIEAVHYALCKGKTTGWSTESKKNSEIVSAWEQEGKQKRLATAQRREKLKEEERQRVAQAEAERKRLEEEEAEKKRTAEAAAEAEKQQRIAEALKQPMVTPTASDFKYDLAEGTYGGVKIIKYLGNAMSIRIPEKIEGLPVTEIAGYSWEDHAFDKNTLVKIVIPSTVQVYTFSGCTELREVIFENGVKSIPYNAFKGCKNLKSIKLPAGLQSIEDGTFEDSGLKSIIIPDSVTKIGPAAFWGCENLKSVTLPKNLKELHEAAFKGCSTLSEIIIPAELKNLRWWWYVFEGCSNLPLATKSKLVQLGYGDGF